MAPSLIPLAKDVDMIVTELAVFKYLPRLTLVELAPGVPQEQAREVASAAFMVSPGLKAMPV